MSMKANILSILSNRYDIKYQSNNLWYTIWCDFCGDSANPNTKHLNIRIPEDDGDNLFMAHCFQPRCNIKYHVLSDEDFRHMGVYDPSILEHVKNHHNTGKQHLNTKRKIFMKDIKLPSEPTPNVKSYFKHRTGLDITDDVIRHFKLVVNLHEFNKMNDHIDISTFLHKYGSDFIGFMNEFDNTILLRNLNKYGMKHVRLKLYKAEKVDLVQSGVYLFNNGFDGYGDIYISEGTFNAVNYSIHYKEPGLYISAKTASSLKPTYKRFVRKYPLANVTFIADDDISSSYFSDIIKYDKVSEGNIYTAYNKAASDFGDITSMDRIINRIR